MCDHGTYLISLCHIYLRRCHIVGPTVQPAFICFGHCGSSVTVDVGKTNLRALIQQRFSDRAPDAPSRSSYEADTV